MSYGDYASDPSTDYKPLMDGDAPVTFEVRPGVSKVSRIFGLLLIGVTSLAFAVALSQYIDGKFDNNPKNLHSLIRNAGFLVMGVGLYIQSRKGSTKLYVDAKGFELTRSWHVRIFSWSQISRLEVVDDNRPVNRGVNVYFHDGRKKLFLPDIFEADKDQLADVMARRGGLTVDNALLLKEEIPYWARKKPIENTK